jgi:hypothetical protein
MDLQATLAGSFTFYFYLKAPPRYEEQTLRIGRLLGRNVGSSVTDILVWQRPPKRSDPFRARLACKAPPSPTCAGLRKAMGKAPHSQRG